MPFKKGNTPAEEKAAAELRRVKKLEARAITNPFPSDDKPGAQMRYVFLNTKDKDLTKEEQALRRYLNNKPGQYRDEMMKHEAVERGEVKPQTCEDKSVSESISTTPQSPDKPEPDLTGAKLKVKIRELLNTARERAGLQRIE